MPHISNNSLKGVKYFFYAKNLKTMLISKFKKKPKKSFFDKMLIKIKCFLGFHEYRNNRSYYTHVKGLDVMNISRRAPSQLQYCKHCFKERIVVDLDHTIL